MAIKHDEQGFLVGQRTKDTEALLQSIRDEIKGLRGDIGLSSATPSAPPVSTPPVLTPTPKVGVDRVASLPVSRPDRASTQARPKSEAVSKPEKRRDVAIRGANGRFSRVGGAGAPDISEDDDSEASKLSIKSAISDMSDKVSGAIGTAMPGDEADPSVKAFNEIAQPLQRGFGKIFGGGDDGNDRWYRRFWRRMRDGDKLDKKRHKEQIEILEDIEKQGGGKKKGGMLRFLMPLFGLLTGLLKMLLPLKLLGALKLLPRFLGGGNNKSRNPAGGNNRRENSRTRRGPPPVQDGERRTRRNSDPNSGANSGSGGSPKASGLGGAAGKGTRRIPYLGALLTLLAVTSDVKASEGDETTTRKEKDVNTGAAIGRGAGALTGAIAGGSAGGMAGAALGTMIFPGVGTAIGGAIGSLAGAIGGAIIGENAGDIIGAQIGEWVGDLRDSDIAGSIISKWNVTTDFVGHLWGQASAATAERWAAVSSTVSTGWNATAEAVSSGWNATTAAMTTGWAVVTAGFTAASDAISSKWDSAVDAMSGAWSKVTDLASSWWGSIKDVANKANDWIAEKTGVDVKQTVTDVTDAAKKSYGDAKDAVKSYVEKAKEALNSGIDRAKDAVAGGVSAVGEATGVSGAVRAVKRSANYATNKQALRQAMANAGITDPKEMAAFMGQMDHESGGLTSLDESFNYSSADRIMAVSGTAKSKGADAVNKAMAQGPEAVAELMYGGRMGNVNAGDGHAFRGRGFTQLTGRDNYTAASKALGIDLVSNPDLASDPEVAGKIATWYWQSRSGLSEAGKAGDVEAATRKINGGTNGLADRKAKTAMYEAEIASGKFSLPSPAKEVATTPPPLAPAGFAAKAPAAVAPEPSAAYVAAREELQTPWASVANVGVSAPSAASVAAREALKTPWTSVARAPTVPESPSVPTPISSIGKAPSSAAGNSEVARDLPDRRIAHVVTGAYSQI